VLIVVDCKDILGRFTACTKYVKLGIRLRTKSNLLLERKLLFAGVVVRVAILSPLVFYLCRQKKRALRPSFEYRCISV
jgi:hypothetical protein